MMAQSNIIEFPNSAVSTSTENAGPAKLLDFCTCRGCRNLTEVDEGTYICSERVHNNDSPIVPVVRGERTSDWGICGGEYYVTGYKDASGQDRGGRHRD